MKEVYFIQRAIAYLVDGLIVSLASLLIISLVSLALPEDTNYENAVTEYEKAYENLIYDVLGSNPVTESRKEDDEVTTRPETTTEQEGNMVTDEPVSEEESTEVVVVEEEQTEGKKDPSEIMMKFYDDQKHNMYIIEKNSILTYLFDIIICIAYFGAFQYYNKGQTLGKKLVSIKVVGAAKKSDYTYISSIIRACFNYGLFSKTLLVILLFVLNENNFLIPVSLIEMVAGIFFITLLVMAGFVKNGRTLSDIICKTKVVSSK